jgi:hypothetical protein
MTDHTTETERKQCHDAGDGAFECPFGSDDDGVPARGRSGR